MKINKEGDGIVLIRNFKDVLQFLCLAFSERWKNGKEKEVKDTFLTIPEEYPCILKYEYFSKDIHPELWASTYKIQFLHKKDIQEEFEIMKLLFEHKDENKDENKEELFDAIKEYNEREDRRMSVDGDFSIYIRDMPKVYLHLKTKNDMLQITSNKNTELFRSGKKCFVDFKIVRNGTLIIITFNIKSFEENKKDYVIKLIG